MEVDQFLAVSEALCQKLYQSILEIFTQDQQPIKAENSSVCGLMLFPVVGKS